MFIKSLVTYKPNSLYGQNLGINEGDIVEAIPAINLPYDDAVWLYPDIDDPIGLYLESHEYEIIDYEEQAIRNGTGIKCIPAQTHENLKVIR
jgi:hypothetical protein